jgi:hypothetical protein
MRRRTFIRTGAGTVAVGVAGCSGLLEERSTGIQPSVLDDRPDAVYRPTHVEGMEMIGTRTVGDRTVGLFYSYPHRFWNVTNARTSKAEIQDDHSVHLMASAWEPDSGTVVPVLSQPTFTIARDDEEIDSKRAWPMLSQNMGFHFGENMSLDGDGTYAVSVEVPAVDAATVGGFDSLFEESITTEFAFEYSEEEKNGIDYTTFDEQAGERAAVSPMEMSMPLAFAPTTAEMPGSPITVGSIGDAEFVATVEESTLVVSPRTPYNRFSVPGFSLSSTVEGVGFDGELTGAIGPDLGAHYRAELPEAPAAGDALTITVQTPTQLSRHEGYETAFLEEGSVSGALQPSD